MAKHNDHQDRSERRFQPGGSSNRTPREYRGPHPDERRRSHGNDHYHDGPAGITLDNEVGQSASGVTVDSSLPEVHDRETPGSNSERMSRGKILLRRFFRNKTAVVGLIGYALLILLAIFGPMTTEYRYDQLQLDSSKFNLPPGTDGHLFGTTRNGGDMWAMTLEGLRKSMIIGLGVAFIQTTIAAIIGSAAAYFGGWFDKVALWIIDLLLVVPSFFIIAIISNSVAGQRSSVLMLILLLAGFGWMLSARVVRSLTMSVKNLDYVRAAKYMSVRSPVIIGRHIIPNISSLLIIDATLGVAGAVLAETSLSYFGFGVAAPEVSLGSLIGQFQAVATIQPWLFWPSAALLTLMLVFINFIGDGVRDALDPSSKSGGQI